MFFYVSERDRIGLNRFSDQSLAHTTKHLASGSKWLGLTLYTALHGLAIFTHQDQDIEGLHWQFI